jgi:phage gpG-like protein
MLQMRISSVSSTDFEFRLKAAISRATQRIAVDLKQALGDALRSGVWSTRTGAADIYETGELLTSGSVAVNENGLTIAYDAPYAALVHFGGYIHPYGNTSTKVYLPPRPWVQSVLNGGGPVPQFDFQQYYTQEITAAFRR